MKIGKSATCLIKTLNKSKQTWAVLTKGNCLPRISPPKYHLCCNIFK